MNFLAHLYLAEPTPASILGNMLGDFVDGEFRQHYSAEICRGILLHRAVDKFTDNHPVFRRSKSRLDGRYRLLKGIVVDVFYDHFLACRWSDYSPQPLEDFCKQVYRIFEAHNHLVPARLQHILPRMISENWLLSYRERDGIARVLKGLSGRLSRPNHLADSIAELDHYYAVLEGDFQEFFPQLVEFARMESMRHTEKNRDG